MPVTNAKFCIKSDIRHLVPIKSSYTGHDDLMDQLIPAATKQIQKFCRRTFIQEVYTEFFPTIDNRNTLIPYSIWLKEIPVATSPVPIIILSYNYDWDNTDALIVDLQKGYQIDFDSGRVDFSIAFRQHAKSLRVVYTGGYALNTDVDEDNFYEPNADILLACAMQTAFLVERFIETEQGVESKTRGGKNTNVLGAASHGLTPEVRSMVASYKRTLVGRYLGITSQS